MEKYTLESFERYRAIKCRPLEISTIMDGAGRSTFQTVRLEIGQALPAFTEKTLLEVRIPRFELNSAAETESALRSLAAQVYQHPMALGVTLSSDAPAASLRRLWEAALWGIDVVCPGGEQRQTSETLALAAASFCRNFPGARKFIHAGSRFEAALKDEPMLGIEVDKALAPAVEALWPAVPLRMAVDPKDDAAVEWAIAHHISVFTTEDPACANVPTHAGYRFQVKTVEIDSRDQAHGSLTAKVTLANAGTLPCYTQGQFRLRLHGSGIEDTRAYDLPLRAEELQPGEERAISQRLDIRGLASGEYDVHAGLFLAGTEYPVSFGIEGRISDGYYEGRLILRL